MTSYNKTQLFRDHFDNQNEIKNKVFILTKQNKLLRDENSTLRNKIARNKLYYYDIKTLQILFKSGIPYDVATIVPVKINYQVLPSLGFVINNIVNKLIVRPSSKFHTTQYNLQKHLQLNCNETFIVCVSNDDNNIIKKYK